MLVVQEESLDDVLRVVLDHLMRDGSRIEPTKGPALEELGAVIRLSNPRARISRSHGRSKIYSALGEFLWYLSGSDLVDPVRYYLPRYPGEVDGRIEGAYGPRLFGEKGRISEIVDRLRENPDSRRAVVQVFEHSDLSNLKDVPCTTTLQFLLRDGLLNLVVNMRSNDAYIGLPHDVFTFTMIQELIARQLGVEIGAYFHFVGSLHLYEKDIADARCFLEEGWQSDKAMPAMPVKDPWPGLNWLLNVERMLRLSEQGAPTLGELGSHPYWDDLARLLIAFRESTEPALAQVQSSFDDKFYKIYLADRQVRLEGA